MSVGTEQSYSPANQWILCKRRWLILAIFVMYTFTSSIQWAQFSIISNLVSKYYNVSETAVEWTANVFMIAYVICIIPWLYALDKLGLRNTLIMASSGMTLGMLVKLMSVTPDGFVLVMVGQIVQSVFSVLTFGLAERVTAVWFGAHEIAFAGAISLLGDQIGSALSFFLPATFVQDGSNEAIASGLLRMHVLLTILSTAVYLLVIFFFEDKPAIPPSIAQVKQRQQTKDDVMKTIMSIIRLPSYGLILVSYGLVTGTLSAMVTLLNQVLLASYPGHTQDGGNIGCIIMLCGIISTAVVGKFLDVTKKFKETALFLTGFSAIGMALFTFTLKLNNLLLVYLAAIFIGFFGQSYYGSGAQLGIEVTYPISEGISSAVMYLSFQAFCAVITIIYGYTIKLYGDLASNVGLTITLIFSYIITMFIPQNLKRQEAEKIC